MAELNTPQVMREITLEVTLKGLPQLRLRLWLFTQLMHLAVWVGGFGGVEFMEAEGDGHDTT